MAAGHLPPPWTVEETDACFIIRDGDRQALAYVYCEDEPGRRTAAKLLTRDEARRIAANIAMPLFMYRCPKTGYRVQGFSAEDTSEDRHVYEPVTCPVCHQIHHVNPTTGATLGEKVE